MFEQDLARSLEPIRKMFLAQSIHALFNAQLFEKLKGNSTQTVTELADLSGMSSYRLEGLILYLKNEGLVDFHRGEVPFLTDLGLSLENSKPWYQLLVGGYGKTLLDLPSTLHDRNQYGSRVGEFVGRGSCGISQFDALPMTKELISALDEVPGCIVDIGCGDGSYLIDLCRTFPDAKALGIEPDDASVKVANDLIAKSDLGGRAEILKGDLELVADLDAIPRNTVFVIAFVLQEALEQSGRSKVVEILRRLKKRHPLGKVVVIEVDRADRDSEKMTSELGLGYYNPYFLLHRLTEQKLETPEFWNDVFSEAGWDIARQTHPETSYDSLGLKIGYLLC
ncbi:methyltransferase domain-containing protein (plasmid) [Aliisedimentitalea scapharcae]|uniref:Methyltransferase domain-containing protein n=1 Tax=Aliisedimentitalea scapharcae TaxID=1524259 RepID=A0ABZ2XZP4_9RHOB